MFIVKKELKQLNSIIYPENVPAQDKLHFSCENRLYRSLFRLFEAFWIYNKKELYIVGGSVRDIVFKEEIKQWAQTVEKK